MLERLLAPVFVLLWSTGFIGAKFGLPYADALHFLSARYVLVIVFMGLAALIFRAPWPRDPRRVLHIAVAGVLIQATYLGGVFVAIQQGLPAALTSLIVGLQPILTALAAGILLGERVSGRQWQGLALGFIGVLLVVSNSRNPGLNQAWQWSALWPAAIALLGITLGTLYQKRFCPHFDLRSGAVIQFAASLLVTLPLALSFEPRSIEWTGSFWFALLWLVLMLSVASISVLNLLIRRGSVVKVTSLFYLTPGVTALCAWLLFDERLGALALLGMALGAFGVWRARAS
ncbi:DMT family transporter [Uliginosibacterium aquaticum]|uniref:DMT family transporter n=1 Tax=Uliginosibacterium aquaticum TaxID=2731212 RepID=A0ABX2IH43_9RHOO|nr:DMT family transporter [Uliginosibacterium aquaticum]NSL55832.1 DMT family transporter [Uliginosibacterium aquaticum]